MSKTTGNRRDDPTELQLALRACGPAFMVVAGFSLAMNLLMLAPAIYMLQVYDRVLTTGSLARIMHDGGRLDTPDGGRMSSARPAGAV